MNWTKALIAGGAGGVVMTFANYVLHGMIMANTYTRYPVFSQEEANPVHFFVVGISIGVVAALFYARTRESWTDGLKGGATFGLWLGLAGFFGGFYNPIVIEGFPYFLSWCWGGIGVIDAVVLGIVVGLIYKRG